MTTDITESEEAHKLHMRLSFYDFSLESMPGQINFSEQQEVIISGGRYSEIVDLDSIDISWMNEQLPTLRTAYNSLELVKQCRLLVLIWASGHGLT